MPRAIPSLFAVLSLSLVLAACGGSSSDDASEQITDVVTSGVTTTAPDVTCKKTFATSWVNQVYGSVTKCLSAEARDAKTNKPATAASVTSVKVDGDTATAFLEVQGGDADGARGALTLTKEDGGWRISDLSPAFLRSQFRSELTNDRSLPTSLKSCVQDQVNALDDDALHTLALGAIGDQPKAQADLQAIITKCAAQQSAGSGSPSPSASTGTVTVLRKQFEQGVTESLRKDGISSTAIACVKRKLRASISDEQILALVGKSSKQVPTSITQATAGALAACDALK